MNSSIPDIVRETRANACIACGKCSAACSMASMYPDFSLACSPRDMVQSTLRQGMGQSEGVRSEYLWRCLQCGNCTAACPEKVDCANLIARLRAHAGHAPERNFCHGCGREILALPVRQWLQNALDPDAATCQEDGNDLWNTTHLRLCPICRRQIYAANSTAG